MITPSGICLCLTAGTLEEDLRLVEKYRRHVDLLELRADFLGEAEAASAARLPGLVDRPVILTVRRVREGGQFSGDERERIHLIEKLAPGGFAFLDLEEDVDPPGLAGKLASGQPRVIRSLHDHAGMPHDLPQRIQRLARRPTEIPKAAVTPKSSRDLLRLLEAFESLRGIEKVLVGMGDFGFPTRVLAQRLGSLFCYSSPPAAAAAPGHTDPATLDQLFRYHRISAGTDIFGVIGNPVMHSLSPRIHNTGFAELGLDAVYLPFLVDELPPFLRAAEILSIRSLSVTVPHKEGIISKLERRDGVVEAMGACNTITRTPGGTWEGTNTDVEGFLEPLRTAFGGEVPRGLGATVIGAGGAARAVVHALVGQGARVLVLNRTLERARRLADAFGVTAGPLDASGCGLMREHGDLVVQTTSAGMTPHPDIDPLPWYGFTGREVAYDLVYAPPTTAFLRRAADAGCTVIRGRQMLLAQAFAQFRLFTGREYPRGAAALLDAD